MSLFPCSLRNRLLSCCVQVFTDAESSTSSEHSVESALVFNASPANVTHVVVDGRIVVDDGKVTFVDEADLLAASQVAATRVFERAGVTSRLNP